ncbi:MAG: 4'-phosphopantetheinyl transferase superfamily protein [Deltaproteobacteria bacterium]|nr:4'-phosphopantetheinyl transferase superfamily protein [Deltaproteobacteria bacterium]
MTPLDSELGGPWQGGRALVGCGVDAEIPARFTKLLAEPHPWPRVYCAREAAHLGRLPDPAAAYCAAFCGKEAAIKALEKPFALRRCELLGSLAAPTLHLDDDLAARRGVAGAELRLFEGHAGEVVAVALLASPRPAGRIHVALEILPLDRAEQEREAAARDLTAAEVAEVSPRRLQTLAGFLALKRALCGLFSGLPCVSRPREEEFELTHRPSGAPCLARCPDHPPGRVFVSLSHSRTCAYGLAVFQEE